MRHTLPLLFIIISMNALSQYSWVQKNDFPEGRYFLTSFTLGDTAYVGLGADDPMGESYNNEWYRYNYLEDEWVRLNDFPGGGRYAPTTFIVNNQAYLCFGVNDAHSWMRDVWRYDSQDDSWERMNDFPGGRRYHAASFVIDSMAYIVGGSYNEGWDYMNDTWQYDPKQDSWTQKQSLPTLHKAVAVGFSLNGFGYVGTGSYDLYTATNDFWEYGPKTNQWYPIPDIPEVPRTGAVSFVLDDFAFVGSGTNYTETYRTFWSFDPEIMNWNTNFSLPPEASPRYGSTAFVINKELFLVAGRPRMYPLPCMLLSDVWSFSSTQTIQESPTTKIQVFPNPASDYIKVFMKQEWILNSTIFLSSLRGQIIIPEIMDKGKDYLTFKVSDLKPGYYVLTVNRHESVVGRCPVLVK
jgi:N-acetylneuraminic acid mutarotase